MLVDNGLDYIKTETDAAFIKTSGFIGFIESVKKPRKFLLGNSNAGVFYRNKNLSVFLGIGEGNSSAFVNEFNRVIYKVINNLMDKVVVCVYKNLVGFKSENFKIFLFDFLFKRKNRSADKFVYIEI